MESRTIFKCFISSPGDCTLERKICQRVVDDINNGLAKHLGINFETVMWEYDVLPDMGRNGQEIIDESINNSDYDIFIGIMKNRFGQPTKTAGSGTEHEFLQALKFKKESASSMPRILFFFGKENVDPDRFDYEQYKRVKEFKEELGKIGLYNEFGELPLFESLLKQKLELFIKEYSPLDKPNEKVKQIDIVSNRLVADLNDSLTTYNERSPIWIDPIISSSRDIPTNPTRNDENKIEIKTLIDEPDNIVIKAPTEFGLTSLAHYLKLEAWKAGKTFLYIDSKKTKKHKIVKDVHAEIEAYYFKHVKDIDCIILDSVSFEENGVMQMIKNICDEFQQIPLLILNTLDNNFFLKSDEDDKIEIRREFISYYLLPLPQNEVRKIVTSYYNIKPLEEDKDVLLNRVTKDLEILNLHRTVKNCISILRACFKIGSEYSPINRTKLLEVILSTIFEEFDIPTYRDKKPDVKDCSFVLGYLCELLVRRKDFEFTDDFFTTSLKEFCKVNYIDLDLQYLLNVLKANSIFATKNSGDLYFRNSYWVFYFLAQRMNMSKDFLNFIYTNKTYIDFPEIMEFYTGIDRNKEEALKTLQNDIEETLSVVRGKVNIPDNLNPFKSISWNPDVAALEREEAKIGENVVTSGLPDEVKDKYDDRGYNQIRPYNQVINSIIRDYSFLVLMNQITASSRALRNSDFVDADLKRTLLDLIIQAWNEINKILIVLSPFLADKGQVVFEGAMFYLVEGDFPIEDRDEKRLAVLLALPGNILKLFQDDLFSTKMGPLIIDKAIRENNSLLKHELMLMLAGERPKGWFKTLDDYIVELDKNSFFLSDVLHFLDYIKQYRTTEVEDKRLIDLLSSKCRAKHIFSAKNPDIGLINRLKKMEQRRRF